MRKAALVFALATFAVLFFRMTFLNDHFDRIARGRQVAAYGEHPFTDFRDPGHFLTVYTSAAAQAVAPGVVGDAFVANAAIATAAALTFWLATALSGSMVIGTGAALVIWLAPPRYYDYEKVLSYTAILALAWRYAARPTDGRAVALGIVVGAAALFRYDNGLYVGAAAAAAIMATHGRVWQRSARHLGLLMTATAATLLPAALFVQFTVGLGEALRQVVDYARAEGSQLAWPRPGLDVPGALYVYVVATIPAALVACLLRRRVEATVAAAVVLLAALLVAVLREPIAARIGSALPVASVLAAYVVGAPRLGARGRVAVGTAALAIVVVGLVVVPGTWTRASGAVVRRLAATHELADPVPGGVFFPAAEHISVLVRYLRVCTADSDRVFLTWFGPEVLVFSARGAAGGLVTFSGAHWSSAVDERRTVAQLQGQRVPLVVMEDTTASLRATFPLLADHLERGYRPAGRVAGRFHLLLSRAFGELPADGRWGVPCPAAAVQEKSPS